jgi:molybdenum cofactor cytidylyltransferase
MHRDTSTAAIILAAGSSSRMGAGRHKLLLPLGDRPVLAHVIEATITSQARPIIVVLGHQATQVRTSLAPYTTHTAITLLENPIYSEGMSTSIHTGLRALMNQQDNTLNGALIILGDQPLMTTHIIDTLIAAKQTTQQRIIAPLYAGKRGNPMLFDVSLFPELLNVTGDEGGKRVIERHRQEMATVELGDAVATYDVDTWEAYQQVVAEWQRKQEQ